MTGPYVKIDVGDVIYQIVTSALNHGWTETNVRDIVSLSLQNAFNDFGGAKHRED